MDYLKKAADHVRLNVKVLNIVFSLSLNLLSISSFIL